MPRLTGSDKVMVRADGEFMVRVGKQRIADLTRCLAELAARDPRAGVAPELDVALWVEVDLAIRNHVILLMEAARRADRERGADA